MSMASDIIALLQLFQGRMPDSETHGWVSAIAADEKRWPEAHDYFRQIRRRLLAEQGKEDRIKTCQYAFEEICLKSLFNETATDMPFDSDTPHWITKTALHLARAVGIPDRDVITIVAQQKQNRTGR